MSCHDCPHLRFAFGKSAMDVVVAAAFAGLCCASCVELDSMIQYLSATDKDVAGGLPSQFAKRDSAFVFTVQTADRLLYLCAERCVSALFPAWAGVVHLCVHSFVGFLW
jgi:hypothetical protein